MFDDSARSGSQMRARLDAAHPDAWRWALSCCRGDRESAMEALHDSYLAILEGRARHSGQSSFKTFLFGVIRLTARATRRKAAFRNLLTAPIETAATLGVDGGQETSATARRIDHAFIKLPQRQRAVAQLVLTHDLTVTEAAEVLGMSRGAASRHYALAKSRLRALLKIEESGDDL
ncbi:MAG: sigma-70 family RNA polymerase sigma factor [Pseudomonadota bacterium]